MFEDVFDMAILYSISPELTCTCESEYGEFHECQQCYEDRRNESELNTLESSL